MDYYENSKLISQLHREAIATQHASPHRNQLTRFGILRTSHLKLNTKNAANLDRFPHPPKYRKENPNSDKRPRFARASSVHQSEPKTKQNGTAQPPLHRLKLIQEPEKHADTCTENSVIPKSICSGMSRCGLCQRSYPTESIVSLATKKRVKDWLHAKLAEAHDRFVDCTLWQQFAAATPDIAGSHVRAGIPRPCDTYRQYDQVKLCTMCSQFFASTSNSSSDKCSAKRNEATAEETNGLSKNDTKVRKVVQIMGQ